MAARMSGGIVVAARRTSSVKVATRAFSPNGSTGTGFFATIGPAFLAGASPLAGASFFATGGVFFAAGRAVRLIAAAGLRAAAPFFASAGRAGFFGFFWAIFA
jgi:hypothetical protein